MGSFLVGIAATALDPLILIGGIFIGYLFHHAWTRLGWMLIFVMPAEGAAQVGDGVHGFLYMTMVPLAVVGLIAAATYAYFEKQRTSRFTRYDGWLTFGD